ncbi:hypothetical protein Syun_022938 [Stephania yunnanensis]|uniref:Uncharacterized protein n=1 Tax=Stephania yunnanensis TaxID=152371 RepID=A0AAP0FAP6_9MAGN
MDRKSGFSPTTSLCLAMATALPTKYLVEGAMVSLMGNNRKGFGPESGPTGSDLVLGPNPFLLHERN